MNDGFGFLHSTKRNKNNDYDDMIIRQVPFWNMKTSVILISGSQTHED
jgi:hypothetical protein